MSVPSNIPDKQRLAALRHVRDALQALQAIHGEWIKVSATRPAATVLKSHLADLETQRDLIAKPAADHYEVSRQLGVLIDLLLGMDDAQLVEPVRLLGCAQREIVGKA